MAAATGIEPSKLLEWVNHADLFRIRGIGSEYADLLEAAGVDTVPELRQRNAKALYETLVKTNAQKHIVRKMPTSGQVVHPEWSTIIFTNPFILRREWHVSPLTTRYSIRPMNVVSFTALRKYASKFCQVLRCLFP